MKEYIKNNLKAICTIGFVICAVLFISIWAGITPDDVFGGLFSFQKYDKETSYDVGVASYDNLDQDQKDAIASSEDLEGDTLTYEEFVANPPEYDGEHVYVTINHNRPFFTNDDKQVRETFYSYSALDELGRAGVAIASISKSEFPEGIRQGDLSEITPSGWTQIDTLQMFNVMITSDKGEQTHYLFNRCHIIAWALGGLEVDERNTITGTVSLNMAMRLYEESIWDFLDTCTEDHVLYRVTPVYKGSDPIASGVLVEGYSLEAGGLFVNFCGYIFNEQPGFEIDHSSGGVRLSN